MMAPMLTAPMYIGEPRWPITALSTRPTRGMVMFERIKGKAILRVCLSTEEKCNFKKDTEATKFLSCQNPPLRNHSQDITKLMVYLPI